MLHTKSQGHRPSGSLKGFYHRWAWQPSWSCDQEHLTNFRSPILRSSIGPVVSEEKMFENVDGQRTEAGVTVILLAHQ